MKAAERQNGAAIEGVKTAGPESKGEVVVVRE
jgi:hypothetical protein